MAALPFSDSEFREICAMMYEAVGLHYNDSKKSLIHSRLAPRIMRTGAESFANYIAILKSDPDSDEFQMAIDLLTTNETYFFREPLHYEVLQKELPLMQSKANLSVWSAACSYGDEAYSTAMLLTDMQASGRIGSKWSILATDISHRVLVSAKEAIYTKDRLRGVSAEHLRRYCMEGDGNLEGHILLQDRIRDSVQFGQLNLCKDFEGIGPFDAIFLRNVLLYFDPKTKSEVMDRVLATLKPGGLFFLGTAEGRVPCNTPLQTIIPGAFRKPV
jgi:chemotaxis protein methyltransferase CheR